MPHLQLGEIGGDHGGQMIGEKTHDPVVEREQALFDCQADSHRREALGHRMHHVRAFGRKGLPVGFGDQCAVAPDQQAV